MLNRSQIIKEERKIISGFLGEKIEDIPQLPNWITNELIQHWNKNMFHIHWLPKITLGEASDFPAWKQKPSKFFYKKIQKREIEKKAKTLLGKWVLIDYRDKPSKRVPWITADSIRILQKIGFNPKNYFKKWNKQKYPYDYLTKVLEKNGFGSRFCLTIQEINDLKPFVSAFLKIKSGKKIRLPFFIEYNYLGNAFYNQWGTTRTWEWFEDELKGGRRLAGGYESVGCVGCDPPEFWSTILAFRLLIEL